MSLLRNRKFDGDMPFKHAIKIIIGDLAYALNPENPYGKDNIFNKLHDKLSR